MSDDGPSGAHEAIAVDTSVEPESGQWAVWITVVFPDEAVRKRINVYRTRRHAEIAAGWIKRAAQRDIRRITE
ncbi:MAG: hypothetical protein AAGA99_07250 [Actinomycetota bacterium]